MFILLEFRLRANLKTQLSAENENKKSSTDLFCGICLIHSKKEITEGEKEKGNFQHDLKIIFTNN